MRKFVHTTVTAALVVGGSGLVLSPASASPTPITLPTFYYSAGGPTGAGEQVVVPDGMYAAHVVAVGAAGAAGAYSSQPGLGARVDAVFSVVPGQNLWVVVGEPGWLSHAGYNGGGAGGLSSGGCDRNGGAGGGATDIRTLPVGFIGSDSSRLVVAAGGGGGGGGFSVSRLGGPGGSAGHAGGSALGEGGGLGGAGGAASFSNGGYGAGSYCPNNDGGGGGGGGGLKGGGGGTSGSFFMERGGGGGGGGTNLVPRGGTASIDTTKIPSLTVTWLPDVTPQSAPVINGVGPFSLGPVVVRYSSTDADSGVLGYRVRVGRAPVSTNSWTWGAYSALTTVGYTSALTSGYTYCFGVVAVDRAGNQSPERQACTASPVDDRWARFSAGWARVRSSVYYGGSLATTKRAGSALSLAPVYGDRVGLLVTTCASCGSVRVYVNGRLYKTVNTWSATTHYRVLLNVATFPSARATITVVSTTNRPVYIDGIGVSKR